MLKRPRALLFLSLLTIKASDISHVHFNMRKFQSMYILSPKGIILRFVLCLPVPPSMCRCALGDSSRAESLCIPPGVACSRPWAPLGLHGPFLENEWVRYSGEILTTSSPTQLSFPSPMARPLSWVSGRQPFCFPEFLKTQK